MTLGDQQRKFMRCLGQLITWTYANGYELTGGELQRTQAEADRNAAQGDGIKNSLHLSKLAIDLNLFRNGSLLGTVADYRPLADYWKTLDPDASWGGDFTHPDADHFSLKWQGVR